MKFKLRLSTNEVGIYREKWGVVAYATAMGISCLAVAIGFYWAMRGHAGVPEAFVIVFCSAFGLAGAVLLLRLPAMARRTFDDNGAHVLTADAAGISITPHLGAQRQSTQWASITDVVLAEKLKSIESGETGHVRRAVIVFLVKDAHGTASLLDRINAGVSRSASGRAYLLAAYPRTQGPALESALRRQAPATVNVRVENKVVFDFQAGVDSYASAGPVGIEVTQR